MECRRDALGVVVPGGGLGLDLGTVARLYLIRVLGKAFESPIERVLDFFAEYRIPLLIASIVLVGGSFLLDKRKGGSDLDVVEELEHEAERDA